MLCAQSEVAEHQLRDGSLNKLGARSQAQGSAQNYIYPKSHNEVNEMENPHSRITRKWPVNLSQASVIFGPVYACYVDQRILLLCRKQGAPRPMVGRHFIHRSSLNGRADEMNVRLRQSCIVFARIFFLCP